jgi:hypothetical protein
VDFDSVRRIAHELPGVEDGTAYGSPAVKVRGKMFVCIPTHRSAERDSLAVRVDFERREELIKTEPDVYYLREHYVNYPVVLVRLNRIHPDALRDLLKMSWQFVSKSGSRGARGRRPRATGR